LISVCLDYLNCNLGFSGSRRAQPQRFLAWNDVGALLCREDDSVSHVEIEVCVFFSVICNCFWQTSTLLQIACVYCFSQFADANRRPIRFQQPFSFTLGALGANGALLASIADDDVPPTLWFQPFDSWVTKPEWLVQMDMKEEPRSMAVGGSFAAVATSSRLLRILTFRYCISHLLSYFSAHSSQCTEWFQLLCYQRFAARGYFSARSAGRVGRSGQLVGGRLSQSPRSCRRAELENVAVFSSFRFSFFVF
jgi:hypothetical protein